MLATSSASLSVTTVSVLRSDLDSLESSAVLRKSSVLRTKSGHSRRLVVRCGHLKPQVRGYVSGFTKSGDGESACRRGTAQNML